MRRRFRFILARRTDMTHRNQLQAAQDTRSLGLIVRIITRPTENPPRADWMALVEGGAVRRAITCTARAPRVRIVRRMATSSCSGFIVRQPGIRSTLQAWAVRPQP